MKISLSLFIRKQVAFSKNVHFGERLRMKYPFRVTVIIRFRVDGRPKRIKTYAFANVNIYVWTGPEATTELYSMKSSARTNDIT